MTTITITNTIAISALKSTDFIEWSRLFKEYETYCTNTIPEEQYRKTFDRLLNPERHVYALVVRESESEEGGKLLGIAHYIMHEMTGSEHMVMLLSDLFIDPSARRRGHARSLILAVAEDAKTKDCVGVRWATHKTNDVGMKLYDQLAKSDFVEYRMRIGDTLKE